LIRTGEARRLTDTNWWPEIALLAGFAVLTAALVLDPVLLDRDVAVRDWSLDHQWRPAYLVARALNQLGSANLLAAICLVIAVAVGVRSRSRGATWRGAAVPLLPILTAYGLSYLVIGPVKLFTDRAAPRASAPDAVELFADPSGWSYPSGHVVNAVIWYQVLVLLLDALFQRDRWPGRRALRVVPPILISCTVTYLAFHWLTDVLAALALGLLLDRLMRRISWPPPL
jgi:membrane-associated phospholipid phosphatase